MKTLNITRVPRAQSENSGAETMDTSKFDNFFKISDSSLSNFLCDELTFKIKLILNFLIM